MNRLCRYKGILTVLVVDPRNSDQYYTFPIEDYDTDIPVVIYNNDHNIEFISVAKLHFSEARRIINIFIKDYEVSDAGTGMVSLDTVPRTNVIKAPIQAERPALLLHSLYNREP